MEPETRTLEDVSPPQAVFDRLFPSADSRTASVEALTKDLNSAPGGIIVDATLPGSVSAVIYEVRLDAEAGTINLQVADAGRPEKRWVSLTPSIRFADLRAAWALALDGRVAAVDLRPPDVDELRWLIAELPGIKDSQLDNRKEKDRVATALKELISVNLHPALVNTAIGSALVADDQLVFDWLHSRGDGQPTDRGRFGFDLTPLREAYTADEGAAIVKPAARQALFYKSIIAAGIGAAQLTEKTLDVQVTLDTSIYWIPIYYPKTSSWFNDRSAELIVRVPELQRLAAFTVGVALCRLIESSNLPNNLDVLLLSGDVQETTPRFTSARRQSQ
jgi:hypothetical protein